MLSTAQRLELKIRLIEQIDHLEASAIRFDQGRYSEANRLAVAVRVLVHDAGKQSKSVFEQLEVKRRMFWLSADRVPESLRPVFKFELLTMRVNSAGPATGVTLHPVHGQELINPPNQVDFDTWWTSAVMMANDARIRREDIVKALANQDGGAHVDLANSNLHTVLRSVPMRLGGLRDDLDPEQRARLENDFARAVMRIAMRTIAEEVRLSYLNQLDVVDPEHQLTRPQPATPKESDSGGPGFERPSEKDGEGSSAHPLG